MKKYFYVYYSYEEFGRGYIGSRICKCLPEEDIKYFGSYKDKTFNPTEKIILEVFSSKKEMLNAEILLHNFYKIDKNSHFANKARQTSNKFSTFGLKHSEETKNNFRKLWIGNRNPNYNAGQNHSFFGKKHTEEWKKQQSIRNIGKKRSEESKKKQSLAMKEKIPWNKGIRDLSITGEKNPRAKKIIFNGETFGCIKDAIEKTGISRHMIKKSCTFID